MSNAGLLAAVGPLNDRRANRLQAPYVDDAWRLKLQSNLFNARCNLINPGRMYGQFEKERNKRQANKESNFINLI
jgi:hypothetical protein